MTIICVEIELDTDTGAVTVGVCPPEEESMQDDQAKDKAYMQPAQSVEDALGTAKDLLSGQTGEQSQDAMAQPDQAQAQPQPAAPNTDMGQAAAQKAFAAIRGGA